MFWRRSNKNVEEDDGLESRSERSARVRSLYIVHTSMLVVSLGSSIIFTGVWPYLYNMDPSVTLTEYGFVVAADAAAQMIFSPIFGIMTDKFQSVRPVALLCCALFCSGNCLYSLVGLFNRDSLFGADFRKTRVYVMLFARFVVGAGTAINSTGRYYVSLATRLGERTSHIALLSLFQTMGFIIGPGIQAALVSLGEEDIGAEGEFYTDMYTATGWVSTSTGLLCLILYLPYIFQEKYIAVREIEFNKSQEETQAQEDKRKQMIRMASRKSLGPTVEEAKKEKPKQLLKQYSRISVIDGGFNFPNKIKNIDEDIKEDEEESETQQNNTKARRYPPVLATITCTYNFFAFLFNFVLLETIVTPLAMDQWGWPQDEAIFNIGMVMIGGGILSMFVFATIGPLSKRMDERLLLLLAGVVPMILGRVVMFPFPGAGYPPMREVNTNLSGSGGFDESRLYGSSGAVQMYGSPITYDLPIYSHIDNNSLALQSFNTDELLPHMSTHFEKLPRAIGDLSETGCAYQWCTEIEKVTVPQFMVGYVLATLGYPFCITLNASLYSKVIGNLPQGFWLGLLTTSGSLARVVGPMFVGSIYENYGTYLTFGLVTGSLVITMALTLITYKQLVPVTPK